MQNPGFPTGKSQLKGPGASVKGPEADGLMSGSDEGGHQAVSFGNITSDFVDWGCDLETGGFGKQLYRSDKGLFNDWRPRLAKIYVCAQIRDMALERQILMDRVIPKLRQQCRNHLMSLTVVDIRMGVTRKDYNERTLKLALEEGDRCHYFACFLGEQYGWCQPVPVDREIFDDACDDVPVITKEALEHYNASRAELIRAAILQRQE